MAAVRLAQRQDADDVVRLMIAFRDWLHAERPAARDDRQRRAAVLLADGDTEYLLASLEPGAAACGVCQLRYRHSVWTGTPDCWLEDLFVEPSGRRRGIGAALVHGRARARAGARRAAHRARHQRGQRAAIALYESCGFSTASKAHAHLAGRDIFMGRPVGASP